MVDSTSNVQTGIVNQPSNMFRTYVPHYWPTASGAALESLTTLAINDDPALSYARHLDIAADLPRLAPNLRVFHWHYGKQYNQERMSQQDLTRELG